MVGFYAQDAFQLTSQVLFVVFFQSIIYTQRLNQWFDFDTCAHVSATDHFPQLEVVHLFLLQCSAFLLWYSVFSVKCDDYWATWTSDMFFSQDFFCLRRDVMLRINVDTEPEMKCQKPSPMSYYQWHCLDHHPPADVLLFWTGFKIHWFMYNLQQ